jgi:hypothetical protein
MRIGRLIFHSADLPEECSETLPSQASTVTGAAFQRRKDDDQQRKIAFLCRKNNRLVACSVSASRRHRRLRCVAVRGSARHICCKEDSLDRIRYSYTLPTGRKIEVTEIGPEEELAAVTICGEADSTLGKIRLAHDLLRRAIVSIDGKPVSWEELEGNKLYRALSPEEFKFVIAAHNKHNGAPSKEELAAFFSSLEKRL